MLAMVNDLLDITAIESGKFSLNLTPTQLCDLVREQAEMSKFRAAKKSISVEENYSDVGTINIDPNRLSQAVDNFISNAIKFSPAGSTIVLDVSRKGASIYIRIKDQGPGFSAVDMERLFSDFQQLSARPTAGEKSTGLGLAIAKRVVDAHGGQIMVESAQGAGTTFTILLPVRDANTAEPATDTAPRRSL
jgi:signal transduction histidine kinase